MLRSVLDAMPHPMWLHSPDFQRVTHANAACERLFGQSRAETGAELPRWLEAVHADDREAVSATLAARAQSGEPLPLAPFRVASSPDSPRWLRTSLHRVEAEDADRRAWLETAHDVTCEVEAAAAQRRSREVSEKVASMLGAIVVVTDLDHRITGWNDQFAELVGEAADSHRGRPLGEIIAPPDLQAGVANAGAGHVLRLGVQHHVAPSGDLREVEWRAAPLVDGAGDIAGFVGVGRDVTREVRASRALHLSDERLATLVKNLPDVPWLYALDPGEFFVTGDACTELWGRSPPPGPRAMDRLVDWIHPDDRGHVVAAYRTVAAEGAAAIADYEYRIVRPDGTIRWARTRVAPVRDEDGRVVELAGYTADVTERREAEIALHERTAELERLVHEKDVLLSEVHHRVKNNLQAVTGLVHMMAAKAHRQPIAETVDELERRIQTMALAHETLYRSSNLAAVDMQAYLARIGEAQHDRGEGTAIAVAVHADDMALDLDGALRCGLIVNELAQNAIKHAFRGRERGRIEITLRRVSADRAVLRVSDDGIGLPRDLDFTSEATLGLRLVQGLAEQLGGSARRAPDAWSAVEVELPLEQ